VRWLFTVIGSASPTGPGQSGDLSLASPDVHGPFSSVRLPKGIKAKVWAKRLSGTVGFTLLVQFSPDATAPSPSWTTIDAERLAAAGSLSLEKRRPIVAHFKTGNEALKLSYADTTGAGTIYAVVEVEASDEDE